MTTKQTAQQLELAAQLIRTGHPFEVRHDASDRWHASLGVNPAQAVLQDWHLRPVLATPPDNRPLHNPDNLTAEAVGVGYRLTVEGESPHEGAERWKRGHQTWGNRLLSAKTPYTAPDTYRLPLSVPWPEPADPYAELKAAHAAGKVIQILNTQNRYVDADPMWISPPERYRIKPEEPAFQLPPPPPGIRWHREDGWQSDDLPSGYRPHVAGEESGNGTQQKYSTGWARLHSSVIADSEESPMRTTRPLTFNHAGKTWTWHRPGDPMPCDGEAWVECLCDHGGTLDVARAKVWSWNGNAIGWRYAEPQTKTVPLGPEDVPPGSVLSLKPPRWFIISGVCDNGVYILDDEPLVENLWKWHYLAEKAQINRSIPLTGKWNPDAWEPCHKSIPQNG